MTDRAEEIAEVVGVVKDVLREYRRMQIFSDAYIAAVTIGRSGAACNAIATVALHVFDQDFPKARQP